MQCEEQQRFAMDAMGGKAVGEVPGIKDEFAERLQSCGIRFAYQLLGKFLMLQKDEEKFKSWLRYRCGEGFGKNRQDLVFQSMKAWAERKDRQLAE